MSRTPRRKHPAAPRPSLIPTLIALLLALGATAPRLCLGAGLPVCLRGDLVEEDLLMARYAETLLKGEWLGALSGATLSKNAGYAVYLMLLAKLNLPYTLANAIFYCLCVLLFCVAVHKFLPNLYTSLAIYVYLLYSPIMLNGAAAQRLCRTGFLSAVTLLLVGSIIGLFGTIVRGQHVIRTLMWSLCASVSFATFWVTKEDGVWMVPFVAYGLIISAIVLIRRHNRASNILTSGPGAGSGAGRNRPSNRPAGGSGTGSGAGRSGSAGRHKPPKRSRGNVAIRMLCLMLPVVSVGAAVFAIKYENNQRYGQFALNDRGGTCFGKVLSDLYHIDDGPQPLRVWLSRAGLEQAFAVSPTLAEAKPYLDGMYEASWAVNVDGEMHGDDLCRALREAAEANGLYAKGGAVVNEYYKKVHAELVEAFENGSLARDTKSIYISPGSRGMTREELREFLPGEVSSTLQMMLHFSLNNTAATPAAGEAENVVRMAMVVRGPFVEVDGANASAFDTAIHFADADRAVYAGVGTFVTMIAAAGFLLYAIFMVVGFFRRDFERVPLMLMSVGLGLSAAVYTCVVLWLGTGYSMEAAHELAYENLSGVILIVNALQALGVSMLVTEMARLAGRLRRMEG